MYGARRLSKAAVAAMFTVAALTACGTTAKVDAPAAPVEAGSVKLNLSPDQDRIVPKKVDSIAAEVPEAIRKRGTLVVAVGAGQNQYPPVGFTATDNKTLIGLDPDTATLIAGVLGLKLKIVNTSFEDVFLGIASGKYDTTIGNITVTAERMEKFDMASYRKELIAFETKKGSKLKISKAEDAQGLKIAALAGSTMTAVLEKWNGELKEKGLKPITIKHYAASSASFLAVQSGAVDAYLTIGSTAEYNAALPDAKIEISGYPNVDPGFTGTLSPKGSGLTKPMCDAVNHVIENGQYETVLKRWNMTKYIVDKCVVNPTDVG